MKPLTLNPIALMLRPVLGLQLVLSEQRKAQAQSGQVPEFRSVGDSGIIAFLNFHEAYDTRECEFLSDSLDSLGLGQGFLAWVSVFHTGMEQPQWCTGIGQGGCI